MLNLGGHKLKSDQNEICSQDFSHIFPAFSRLHTSFAYINVFICLGLNLPFYSSVSFQIETLLGWDEEPQAPWWTFDGAHTAQLIKGAQCIKNKNKIDKLHVNMFFFSKPRKSKKMDCELLLIDLSVFYLSGQVVCILK